MNTANQGCLITLQKPTTARVLSMKARMQGLHVGFHADGKNPSFCTMTCWLKRTLVVPVLSVSWVKSPPALPAIHMGIRLSSGCPLPIQLSVLAWESRRWPMALGPCACVGGRPGRSPWLLVLDQCSSSHCSHLGSEPANGRPLSLSLCLCNYAFQINN